ncbi:MAG: hypothetical protein QOE97_3119 [Pseudonocardiales bacterium]|nr:hypothetical protein [Pseudonocardiales bacterium]
MISPDAARVTRTRLATGLPEPIDRMLRNAHRAEQTAQGTHRRAAFQLTRNLLGGAHRAGYPVRALAECLGLSHKSLRARCGADGWLSTDEVAAMTDTPPVVIARWLGAGRISSMIDDRDGTPLYLASEVIQAVVKRHRDEISARLAPE